MRELVHEETLAAAGVYEGEENLLRAGSPRGGGVGHVGPRGLGIRGRKWKEKFLSDYEPGVD